MLNLAKCSICYNCVKRVSRNRWREACTRTQVEFPALSSGGKKLSADVLRKSHRVWMLRGTLTWAEMIDGDRIGQLLATLEWINAAPFGDDEEALGELDIAGAAGAVS